MSDTDHVWVFVGDQARNTSGVFTSLELAENWISRHSLTGLLTHYPLNEGVFDWVVRTTRVKESFARGASAGIIGSFCSHLDHFHYQNGERTS